MGAENLEMTAGDRGGDGVGAGLDAVADQLVPSMVEGTHPLQQNPMRPRALDARAHGGEAEREVADFGIARGVQDFAFAACEHRRHQGRLGRADRRRGQHDTAAAQAVALAPRVNVTRLHIDLGAERVERFQVQVDRPCADRATARHGHARRAETGKQRRQDEDARAHAADQVIGRLRVAGLGSVQHERPPGSARGVNAEFPHHGEHGVDVRHFRNIAELQPLGAEQRGGNLRQSRILGPPNLDGAFNASAAANDQSVHAVSSFCPRVCGR